LLLQFGHIRTGDVGAGRRSAGGVRLRGRRRVGRHFLGLLLDSLGAVLGAQLTGLGIDLATVPHDHWLLFPLVGSLGLAFGHFLSLSSSSTISASTTSSAFAEESDAAPAAPAAPSAASPPAWAPV